MDFRRNAVLSVFLAVFLVACGTTPLATSKNTNIPVTENPSGQASHESVAASSLGESTEEQQSLPLPPSSNLVEKYRIGVDDVVEVSVWRNEKLSVKVPVRPDGMISIPLAGDVLAGGLTPTEVAESVRKKLSNYVRDPQVTVILTQLHSHEYLSRVRVTGAVRTPVSIAYRQGMTILDVVLAAGGITEFAAPNNARLYRKDGDKTQAYRVKLGDILSRGKLKTNVDIRPGDVITIPERLF